MFRKMYNNQNPEHNNNNNNNNKATGLPPPTMTSPRISFSNDFVESSQYSHSNFNSNSNSNFNSHRQIRAAAAAYRDAPVSSDFEFSVTNYSMMSADELFFKGRLLPLKESCCSSNGTYNGGKTTTLRDELEQNEEEEEEDGAGGSSGNGGSFSLRPPKNPTRWRGFLGLRKSHIGSKKSDKSAAADKRNTTSSYNQHDDVQCSNNNSQGFVD
ncbi:hypothetical protein ABFS82_08G048900 [Erythranthe guttata]|uniref:Uncharacterized protein n=1 Tax=Erythranthe guttata TaxID=4155 RepID=A0A022RWG7_ERYGU|nr:PREDICTED: myb-like protein A [Erythranthe guttata]EYU44389.1 hypothetical protein MIMGU_mgv1a013709mg [Erythranthe guttata]|eukprot:XP_012856233.1 PREDICTED: myb-like protein A [Erythranthe guttata]